MAKELKLSLIRPEYTLSSLACSGKRGANNVVLNCTSNLVGTLCGFVWLKYICKKLWNPHQLCNGVILELRNIFYSDYIPPGLLATSGPAEENRCDHRPRVRRRPGVERHPGARRG